MKKLLTTLLLAAAPFAHGAIFIDDFDNTDSLNGFGVADYSVSNNILTLTATQGSMEAGVNWFEDQLVRFSLNPADSQSIFEITPVSAIGDGQWNVSAAFFDSEGAYLDQGQLIGFSNSTSIASVNVNDFAVENAASYEILVRIQASQDSGFTFSQFAAVPEPANMAMLGGLLVAMVVLLRRRMSRS